MQYHITLKAGILIENCQKKLAGLTLADSIEC